MRARGWEEVSPASANKRCSKTPSKVTRKHAKRGEGEPARSVSSPGAPAKINEKTWRKCRHKARDALK